LRSCAGRQPRGPIGANEVFRSLRRGQHDHRDMAQAAIAAACADTGSRGLVCLLLDFPQVLAQVFACGLGVPRIGPLDLRQPAHGVTQVGDIDASGAVVVRQVA
jgi:hypothetical protein